MQFTGSESRSRRGHFAADRGRRRDHSWGWQSKPGIQIGELFRRRNGRSNHFHDLRSRQMKGSHFALRSRGTGRNYANVKGWSGLQPIAFDLRSWGHGCL